MSALCPPPLMIDRKGEHVVLWPVEDNGIVVLYPVADDDEPESQVKVFIGGIELNHREDWYGFTLAEARRLAIALLAASEWAELAAMSDRTTASLTPTKEPS